MRNLLSLLWTVFVIFSCSVRENETHNASSFEKKQELVIEKEQNYPWTPKVTQAAIEAIHKSIRNLDKPEGQREKNFPADPYAFPFNQTEVQEYKIIGFSHSPETPDIYQIDFRPTDEIKSGPRITVEINIKTQKPLRVFMQADS